jgi:AraC family transcriptional regulator
MFTRPGDLLLSLPDRPTAFHIEDRRELVIVQVAPAHASLLLEQAGGARLDDLTPLLAKPMRDTLAAELCRRLEHAGDAAATINEWMLGLLMATLLAHARATLSSPRRPIFSASRLQDLQDYITAHLDEPHSIEALATRAQLPRRVFAATFREATGLPVHQYVLRQRALRAAELLVSTDMPLAMLAAQCGFAHQAHMGRVVKQLLGRTPGTIRSGK